jgi:hypothetical protein
MSKSIFQNIPEAEKLLGMETEELAGYMLEHLHSLDAHSLQTESHPINFTNSISRCYPAQYTEKIKGKTLETLNFLSNQNYIYPRNNEGWFSIADKGNKVKTASEFNAQWSQNRKVTPQSDRTQQTINTLKLFLDELNNIEASLHSDGYSKMGQRFDRWKSRCIRFIADNFGGGEAEKLSRYEMLDTATPQIARHRHNHTVVTFKECRSFLEVLLDEVERYGEDYLRPTVEDSAEEANEEPTTAPATPSPAIPTSVKSQSNVSYDFPKIELSTEEQQWLGTICQQFLKGYLVDVDRLKKSWYEQGKWPNGFRPSEIDSRLLRNGNKPTLLGIWHAYPGPENKWIEKSDQLIRYVKERISNSTSKEIKVAEIAEAIGVTERSVSVLIHLLPSMGFYYTATVAPVRHDIVRIPGELDMYTSLRLDDPEKMDDYLSYKNMEKQIKKVYGEAETESRETSTKVQPLDEDKLIHANQLYDKVKNSIHNTKPLDQNTAKLIIESADDAIKEFGSTSQEKKIELRLWKAQAELILPPSTIEELRKRAEGQLLKRSYPKNVVLRNVMLALIALGIVILGLFALWRALSKSSDMTKVEPSPSPIPAQSTEPALNLTPTPVTTPSLEPKHITLSQMHNYRISENSDYVIEDDDYEILLHCKDIWFSGQRVSLELRLPRAATNNLQDIDLPLGSITEVSLGRRSYSLTVDDIANDINGPDTARITMTRSQQSQ